LLSICGKHPDDRNQIDFGQILVCGVRPMLTAIFRITGYNAQTNIVSAFIIVICHKTFLKY